MRWNENAARGHRPGRLRRPALRRRGTFRAL